MDEIKAISRILKDLMEIEYRLDECSKKHKTVPRKKPIKRFDKKHKTVPRKKPENRFDRKPIFRPGKWSDMMDRPAIGDKVFIATMTFDDDIDIVESRFSGANTELLMLAQGRLFFDWEEAEMYVMHCKEIIAAMRAQLPELEDGFDDED